MVNCREYWMNACTSAQHTAIPTYTRFPMNVMAGMISPDVDAQWLEGGDCGADLTDLGEERSRVLFSPGLPLSGLVTGCRP